MARKLRELVDARYVRDRGLGSGFDSRMTETDVYRFLARKVRQRANAAVRGFPSAYIGQRVRLLNRSYLTLGNGVVLGEGVLIDALSEEGVVLGDAATVDVGAVVRGSGGVRRVGRGVVIGRRAAVGAFNFIHGGGGVTIGDDVLLGPYVQIFSENHNIGDGSVPIIEQGESPAPVVVGAGSWIGAGSIILAGTTIGAGVVVAAGSVVTTDLPDGCVAAGTPARVLRQRVGDVDRGESAD